MAKLVKHQIDFKKYVIVSCETSKEVEAIKESNRIMDRFIKSEFSMHSRTISYDFINRKRDDSDDVSDLEFEDSNGLNPMEAYIRDKRNDELSRLLKLAISNLNSKQQKIISLKLSDLKDSEIADKLNIDKSTLSRNLKVIYSKMRPFLEDFFNDFIKK